MMRLIVPGLCGVALLGGCDSGDSKPPSRAEALKRLYLDDHPGKKVEHLHCARHGAASDCEFTVDGRACTASLKFDGDSISEGAYACDPPG